MTPHSDRRTLLGGWGNVGPSAATLVDVDRTEAPAAVKALPRRGGIARGLGRSYGDAAQNAGGHVIRLTADQGAVVIDPVAGSATAAAGVSFEDLLAYLIPRGWFVPVTPGTRFITVGGAVASDIHGKNHHRDGSFGDHVLSIDLLTADSEVVTVRPDPAPGNDHELFWATIGGMGLTGIVLAVTFRLLPIETSRMAVETQRVGDLDDLMAQMAASDANFRYSVAWIDLLARGKRLGRGVLTNGDHATTQQLTPAAAADPLAFTARSLVKTPPFVPPAGVINRASVAAFNEVWLRRARSTPRVTVQSIPGYFHPLDLVSDWNRVYGRSGFVQYQVVVPVDADRVVHQIVERLAAAQLPIFLTVLKRFGEGNAAPLSFPRGGWTLAVDVATDRSQLAQTLRGLDQLVLDAGGRHYLAKDFHILPEDVRRGYPRLAEWQAVRERVDPANAWASDLSRRLQLTN